MKLLIAISLLGLTMILISCQTEQADALTADEKMQLEQEITARLNEWVESVNKVDIELAETFLTRDFRIANNSNVYTGRDTFIETWRPKFARLSYQNTVVEKLFTKILSPTIGIQIAEGTFTTTDTSGITSDPIKTAWTLVWSKQNDQWLIEQASQSY